MQENALHGWRISDAKDMRMGGYPAKVRSLAFLEGGRMLATAGAQRAWWSGRSPAPTGRWASRPWRSAGTSARWSPASPPSRRARSWRRASSDGRIWACDVASGQRADVRADVGPPISALAMAGGRIAWGDEEGGAGVLDMPAL